MATAVQRGAIAECGTRRGPKHGVQARQKQRGEGQSRVLGPGPPFSLCFVVRAKEGRAPERRQERTSPTVGAWQRLAGKPSPWNLDSGSGLSALFRSCILSSQGALVRKATDEDTVLVIMTGLCSWEGSC